MRNNLKKKVCSLLVATLMTTATFANGFTYGGITVSAEESNVTVQNSQERKHTQILMIQQAQV